MIPVGVQIAHQTGPSEPAPLKQRPDAKDVERLAPRTQHGHDGWIPLGCRFEGTVEVVQQAGPGDAEPLTKSSPQVRDGGESSPIQTLFITTRARVGRENRPEPATTASWRAT